MVGMIVGRSVAVGGERWAVANDPAGRQVLVLAAVGFRPWLFATNFLNIVTGFVARRPPNVQNDTDSIQAVRNNGDILVTRRPRPRHLFPQQCY